MQKELGKIGLFNYQGEDRFEKLILALLVELGECANCWRGFKFWSTNQQPKTKELRNAAMMEEDKEYYNPLLEEYVDGLHFILDLGIELDLTNIEIWEMPVKEETISQQYIECIGRAYNIYFQKKVTGEVAPSMFEYLLITYLTLGEMLGFTWEQVEQAYCEKHAINIQRQASGY